MRVARRAGDLSPPSPEPAGGAWRPPPGGGAGPAPPSPSPTRCPRPTPATGTPSTHLAVTPPGEGYSLASGSRLTGFGFRNVHTVHGAGASGLTPSSPTAFLT